MLAITRMLDSWHQVAAEDVLEIVRGRKKLSIRLNCPCDLVSREPISKPSPGDRVGKADPCDWRDDAKAFSEFEHLVQAPAPEAEMLRVLDELWLTEVTLAEEVRHRCSPR